MVDESLHFDRAAGYYDATRGYPPGVDVQVARLVCAHAGLDRTSEALEIGVGTGRIALPLAREVRAVAGLDLSRTMLARLLDKRNGEALHAVLGSASALPFPARRFDAVVAVHVFHLIADWRGALGEIARVLRPQGCLLAGSDGPLLPELWRAVNAVVPRPRNVGAREGEDYLADAGFTPRGEAAVLCYVQRVELAAFLEQIERRVWSSLWRLDDDAHRRLVERTRSELAARYGGTAGTLEVERRFSVRAYSPPAA